MKMEERPYFVFVSEPDGKEFRHEKDCLDHEAALRLHEDPKYLNAMISTLRRCLLDMKRHELPKQFKQYVAAKTGFLRMLRMQRKSQTATDWLHSLEQCAVHLASVRTTYENTIRRFRKNRDDMLRMIDKRNTILLHKEESQEG